MRVCVGAIAKKKRRNPFTHQSRSLCPNVAAARGGAISLRARIREIKDTRGSTAKPHFGAQGPRRRKGRISERGVRIHLEERAPVSSRIRDSPEGGIPPFLRPYPSRYRENSHGDLFAGWGSGGGMRGDRSINLVELSVAGRLSIFRKNDKRL